MDITNSNSFDTILSSFKRRGVQPLIFARRLLVGEELEKYLETYKSFRSDPQIQEEELKQLGLRTENSLEYIGTIGLIDSINPEVIPLFQFI